MSKDRASVEGVVDPVRAGDMTGDCFAAPAFSLCVTASDVIRRPFGLALFKKEKVCVLAEGEGLADDVLLAAKAGETGD